MQSETSTVWIISSRNTGQPAFTVLTTDETQQVIGPFVYSKKADAKQAANSKEFAPSFLSNVDEDLSIIEVQGEGLIHGVLSRFSPANADVFVFDEGLFPLTQSGASWVDMVTGRETWSALFAETNDDRPWMELVLKSIADSIGLNDFNVSFGSGSDLDRLLEEKVAVVVEPCTFSSSSFMANSALSPNSRFRLYTKGMTELGRSELELVDIPPMFLEAAEAMLLHWAAYSIDNEIEAGSLIVGSESPITVLLKATTSEIGLRLSVDQVVSDFGPQHMVH